MFIVENWIWLEISNKICIWKIAGYLEIKKHTPKYIDQIGRFKGI